MNSTTSKERHNNKDSEKCGNRDRLSELPDDILVHILSFLPTLDAVRTVSIRRFGDLWTLSPSLVFDDSENLEEIYWPYENVIYNSRFTKFVHNVVTLHKRTLIDKFKLSFNNIDLFDDDYEPIAHEVTTWINFALDRQVKALDLRLVGFEPGRSVLPRRVFTNAYLVILELYGCRINDLSECEMGSLKKLSLSHVDVSNELFKRIILGCPSLQELALKSVFGLNELCFTAPTIEKLVLDDFYGLLDCPNLRILDFTSTSIRPIQMLNVSSIREVNIRWCCYVYVFDAYLKKLCDAETFKFSDSAFLSSNFSRDFLLTRWKLLHIKSLLCGGQFLGICRLLRCTPYLEELVVYTDSELESGRTPDTNMFPQELPSCLIPQLKIVTMLGYEEPCNGLLELAAFLLKSSVSLEKIVILPSKKKSAAVNALKLVEPLLSFPRASSKARVIFGSEIY